MRRPPLVRLSAGRAAILVVALAVVIGPLAPADRFQGGRDRAALAAAQVPVPKTVPAPTAFDPTRVAIGLSQVASGLASPVLVTHAGDGSGRLFVVEQAGRIRVIAGGHLLPTPFLDLTGSITSGGERGLLGLAFHPSYPALPYIYVNFTDRNGATAISRYTVSSNPDVINKATGVRILTIAQPYANHNGGHLAFGPDGYLYIGMGDGGSSGDPQNRAQNIDSLLGKMLRIDINHGTRTRQFVTPAGNPYIGRTGSDLIWSRGLRNPWRWSFDRETGGLWIADVGQERYEEVNRSMPSSTFPAGRGINYGWPVLEGRACYRPSSGCSTAGKTVPVVVYGHAVAGADNCSVTGGYVYRGSAYPMLVGGYLYGDFCSGRMWLLSAGAVAPASGVLVRGDSASPKLSISSFGEDEAGELYVTSLTGTVYRITATAT
jgi:glucose/arabinose dehydrogenase